MNSGSPSWLSGLLTKAGAAVVAAIVILLFGGTIFAQYVWPFLRDNTETWTCRDEELEDFCDDPFTLAGFLAEVCGRSRLTFTGTFVDTILIGSPRGENEPGILEFRADCRDTELEWAIEEGGEIEDTDDLRDAAQNDKARLAVDLLDDWSFGLIDKSDARRELIGDD